ncbi:MAG: acyl-CoA dehydrogenase C-terminal domain-containing protein, partial [Actinomycetes bacterium]
NPVAALAGATPYLRIFGTVNGGWLLARLALGARADLEGADPADVAWLQTKIASARFFAEQVLPTAAGLVPSVQAGSSVLYEVTPVARVGLTGPSCSTTSSPTPSGHCATRSSRRCSSGRRSRNASRSTSSSGT